MLHDTTRVFLLNRLANISNFYDPIAAFHYGQTAMRLADSINFTRGQAEAYRQIGLSLINQNNISGAINHFLSGLRIAEANRHTQIEADITGNLGTAYNQLNSPKEALIFLTRALTLQQNLKNKVRESATLNNVGDSYFALKKYDKARQAYQEALTLSEEQNFKMGITTNMRNLGNVMEATNQLAPALAQYFISMKLSSGMDDTRGYILSNKSIASVYLKMNKASQAKTYAETALRAALRSKLRGTIPDLYKLLYQISKVENDLPKSFEYFKFYIAYKDSSQNLKTVSDIASQRLVFETEKKQAEVELLTKDAELQLKQISGRKQLIAAGFILLLIAVLWMIVSIINSKRINRKNEILSDQIEEIYRQQQLLRSQRDELMALNEELRQQQDEAVAQRDSLADKNDEIEQMNQRIVLVNETLDQIVANRTKTLNEQNEKLLGYAFINAHKLRAPLARIMGLANLLQLQSGHNSDTEHYVIVDHLWSSASELNTVVQSFSTSKQTD